MSDKVKELQTNPIESNKDDQSLWTVSFVEVSKALDHISSSEDLILAVHRSHPAAQRTKEAEVKLREKLKPFNSNNFTTARALKPVF